MVLIRQAGFWLRHAALWSTLATGVLCIVLAALGFFMAAVYLALAKPLGAAGAAALNGALLLLFAGLAAGLGALVLAAQRGRRPSTGDSLADTAQAALLMLSGLVRRDPKKALLMAALAGALTEFLAGRED